MRAPARAPRHLQAPESSPFAGILFPRMKLPSQSANGSAKSIPLATIRPRLGASSPVGAGQPTPAPPPPNAFCWAPFSVAWVLGPWHRSTNSAPAPRPSGPATPRGSTGSPSQKTGIGPVVPVRGRRARGSRPPRLGRAPGGGPERVALALALPEPSDPGPSVGSLRRPRRRADGPAVARRLLPA